MTTDRHIEMLFALLRLGLGTGCVDSAADSAPFEKCGLEDWQRCYKEAVLQGVAAMAWDGLMMISKEQQPPISVRVPWGLYVEQCESKYRRYCHTAAELSAKFGVRGIAMMQIKGVGFASWYPNPSHREGGDIDIYTFSSNPAEMSHAEANALADSLMAGSMIEETSYKHSNFIFKGISVENHKYFLNVKTYRSAKQLDKVLMELMNPAPTPLLNGEVSVLTPSTEFCAIHIAYHALSHYYSGLRLHHLCDWAMVLKRTDGVMPSQVTDRRFIAWTSHLTQLCNRYLALNRDNGEVSSHAKAILDSIFDPKQEMKVPYKDPLRIVLYKTVRMCRREWRRRHYLGGNLMRFSWVMYYIKNPHRIFVRT